MPRSIELTELERRKMAEAGRQSIPRTHGWRPIETFPFDGSEILVTNGETIWLVETEYEMYPKGNGCGCCSYSIHHDVTHWQPLPKLPNAGEPK